ncbi:unnamed protein product, partial [Prunus brigantina]
LAKFDAYHKAIERSKSMAVAEAYKLGYFDCKSSAINVVDIEVAEEHVANETATEEDDAKEGEQATRFAKQMAASDEHVAKLG